VSIKLRVKLTVGTGPIFQALEPLLAGLMTNQGSQENLAARLWVAGLGLVGTFIGGIFLIAWLKALVT
jgi:hypothetical protein